MDPLIPDPTPDQQHAIDRTLMRQADDDATRYMLRWALNDGNVPAIVAFFPAQGRVDELTRAVNKIFATLGPNGNYARYRTAILRLGELRREMHLTPLD